MMMNGWVMTKPPIAHPIDHDDVSCFTNHAVLTPIANKIVAILRFHATTGPKKNPKGDSSTLVVQGNVNASTPAGKLI